MEIKLTEESLELDWIELEKNEGEPVELTEEWLKETLEELDRLLEI